MPSLNSAEEYKFTPRIFVSAPFWGSDLSSAWKEPARCDTPQQISKHQRLCWGAVLANSLSRDAFDAENLHSLGGATGEVNGRETYLRLLNIRTWSLAQKLLICKFLAYLGSTIMCLHFSYVLCVFAFGLYLKHDPKLRGPFLWTNIADFKFPKNGLWTRTFFFLVRDFASFPLTLTQGFPIVLSI